MESDAASVQTQDSTWTIPMNITHADTDTSTLSENEIAERTLRIAPPQGARMPSANRTSGSFCHWIPVHPLYVYSGIILALPPGVGVVLRTSSAGFVGSLEGRVPGRALREGCRGGPMLPNVTTTRSRVAMLPVPARRGLPWPWRRMSGVVGRVAAPAAGRPGRGRRSNHSAMTVLILPQLPSTASTRSDIFRRRGPRW